MALSPSDQARLTALTTARDNLISGKAIAEVDYNGEKRVYAKGDLVRLDREIAGLNGGYGTMRVRL